MNEQIQLRLEEVLLLMPCTIAGCWGLHGAKMAHFFDEKSKRHVLEVWPNTFHDPGAHDGHGDEQADDEVLFGLAEFDFMALVKTVALERFHFSQEHAIFEIGWQEFGQRLALRIHLVPEEMDEESSHHEGNDH